MSLWYVLHVYVHSKWVYILYLWYYIIYGVQNVKCRGPIRTTATSSVALRHTSNADHSIQNDALFSFNDSTHSYFLFFLILLFLSYCCFCCLFRFTPPPPLVIRIVWHNGIFVFLLCLVEKGERSLLWWLFVLFFVSLIWEWGVVNDDEMRHVRPLTSASPSLTNTTHTHNM
jgi:hypothetical protein